MRFPLRPSMIGGICLAALAVLTLAQPLRAGIMYNAAADFSLAGNPNGAWSYGYSTTLGGSLILYTASSTTTFSNPNFSSWQGGLAPYYTPLVMKNLAATTQQGFGANLLPGELAFHPGIDGQFSIVAWTAPDSGTLSLAATFEGRDNGNGTTTDVHVLDKSASLFNANVNGFGSSTDQSFSTSLSVNKGDVMNAVALRRNALYGKYLWLAGLFMDFCPDLQDAFAKGFFSSATLEIPK